MNSRFFMYAFALLGIMSPFYPPPNKRKEKEKEKEKEAVYFLHPLDKKKFCILHLLVRSQFCSNLLRDVPSSLAAVKKRGRREGQEIKWGEKAAGNRERKVL